MAAAQIGPQATRIAGQAGAEGAETGAKTTARASDEVPELLARRETGTVGGVDATGTPRLLRRPGVAGGPVTRTGAEGAETAVQNNTTRWCKHEPLMILLVVVLEPQADQLLLHLELLVVEQEPENFSMVQMMQQLRGARSTRADAPTGTRSGADDATRGAGVLMI